MKPKLQPKSRPEKLIKSANLFPVVGIGASAGGLDAFKKLLKAISEDSGMAYVLVQHLDPNHESMLPEILQKVTNIPVLEITDDIKVQPDHIYVIPSNKMMVATDGVLLLAPRPVKSKTERNLPIDLFFTSLAEVHQEHAIGVVLSGTASDGTQGLRAIKDNGGITFAQDEASAEYDGMPHSAAQAGVVDFILPPEQIPKKLLEVTSKTVLSDEELQSLPPQEEDVFKHILSLLRIRKGVDFTYYKQTTVRRRILRRKVVNKNEEPADYLKFLRANTTEQDMLYQDMLIPVTSFFRDKKVFENICKNVFPEIVKNKIPGEIVRIWVAGCSTGQEVYSFAMCFKEFLGDHYERIQIFGTDLSEPAIAQARTGLYDKSELSAVSPTRLHGFFTKHNGSYQVNKSIRDMCVFAHHNFLKDPPFGKMDCISCRNVLIYMEPYLQKKALTTFHYALNPKGFLLLGKSETTSGVPDLFATVEKNDKLYTRKDAPGRFIQITSQRSEQILSRANNHYKNETIRTDFQKTADDILLTKYTPAGVVVNESMDIVHFRGNTGNYLEQAPGKPSHNLLMMAKHGLAFELRNILHKAKNDKIPVIKDNIPLHVNGHLRYISIEALPLPNTLEPYHLILFHDNNLKDTDGSVISKTKKISAKSKKDEKDIRIQLLEQELAQAREDMRSITEDQEASNEELQSANEELLSGSEELQSLNEELETSKEELQSTNEELTVLNHELLGLNEQVTDARNYSESIVATLYQPLLVLDKNLRVKTANKAFYETFQVNEQETEGVLIYDLGNRQWNIPELRTLLEEILPQKTQITDYEVTHNFSSIGVRIILLSALEITREKKEEKLILLSIEDITEEATTLKRIEDNNKRYYRMLMESAFAFSIMKGKDMVITLANDLMIEFWGKGLKVVGKTLLELLPELKDQPFPDMIDNVYTTGQPCYANEILARLKHKGKMVDKYFNIIYQPHYEANETISGVITIAYEVTEMVLARKKIEESENRFRLALSGSSQIVFSQNTELKHTWIYNSLSGFTSDSILGKTDNDLHLPQYAKILTDIKKGVLETGVTYNGEIELEVLGKPLFYEMRIEAIKNEEGIITGIIGVANDITKRILGEEKIKQSEERFQAAVAAVEGILWTNNAKGEMEGVQKGWTALTGQTYKKYQGFGWADAIHPEDAQATIDAWIEAVHKRKNFIYEHRILMKNKKWGHFSVRAIPLLNPDGIVKEWVGVHTDITERRLLEKAVQESEEQFKQLAELMPQKVWTADAQGNKTYFNQTLLEYVGMPFEELIGEGWKNIIHPDDWDEDEKQWLECLISGDIYQSESRFLRKDGKYLWHLTLAVPLKDKQDNITMWIGSKTEIQEHRKQKEELEKSISDRTHELKQANKRLGEKNDELVKMNAELEAFAYVSSHDLQEPLRKIQTFSGRILEKENKNLSEKGKNHFRFIQDSANRMQTLIKDLLAFSKVNNTLRKFENTDLNTIIDQVKTELKDTIDEKHATIEATELCPANIIAFQFRQLMLNLIGNSLKFSKPTQPPHIIIKSVILKGSKINNPVLSQEKNYCHISISDNGIGFKKEYKDKIFEVFQRLHGKEEYAGTGIGLAIVKKIIDNHNGIITAESKLNKGTTFDIYIPSD